MTDAARRPTGPVVAAAALAAAVAFGAAPSPPQPSPRDFGPARAAPAAASEGPSRAGPARSTPPPRTSPPRRVLVPSVGLDAPVRPVGVTGAGDLAVPSDPSVARWYRFGPALGGARGSSVPAGHVDDDTGEFAALYAVEPGDRGEVRRAGAGPAAHRTVARATVPKDALAPSVLRRSGPPVPTLITCAPPFVPEEGGYRADLVVTAAPTGE